MSYLAPVVEVGGQGGYIFYFNGTEDGSLVKMIQFWEGEYSINAVKVWLTDDRSAQYGDPAGNLKEFKFEDGEHFTSLSLWPNKDGKRLGAIKFKTSHSREFYAKLTKGGLKPEVPVDVASGICMGIKGRSGLDIDRLGFLFINTVKSAQLTDVVYPTIHDVIPKVAVGEIKSMSYQNNTSVTQEYKIEISKKIIQKSSWSVKGKMEITYSLKVNAGIPFLVEGKSRFGLTLGVEGTYASETSTEKMELFSFPVKVPAGKTVDVDITLGQATVDLPFTGIMKITCHNGGVLEYKTSGTYKGVVYSDGKVVVNESNKMLDAV
ncbi:aerolysin-like protein [Tachysurus fulvidraco]|uniref:aerolysin-like protein n=1 Tax=Tachysurus fulvidraco TaxID=1234273 RepID=UPI001FEF28D7|nr:aerolysin-like protein [Tachysurus fulvidraco]XP_047656458.1 aerolysin-like protein [Tachysurus fulvidraco]XP_047656459.1 aerolysin-like protein [Tachysurus fulvidraco]XP_047656460.1 aerolysin-like protein [Tachysurus fulvidraco]